MLAPPPLTSCPSSTSPAPHSQVPVTGQFCFLYFSVKCIFPGSVGALTNTLLWQVHCEEFCSGFSLAKLLIEPYTAASSKQCAVWYPASPIRFFPQNLNMGATESQPERRWDRDWLAYISLRLPGWRGLHFSLSKYPAPADPLEKPLLNPSTALYLA